MDAQELGMLGSALAGGRDWSSIKQRGAVTCVLSRLQGAVERGNHPANPLPSESEHLQGWGGEDAATLMHHLSGHHLWLLQAPRDSWKPLGFLRHPSMEATYPVPRLAKGCGSWRQRGDAVGLVGCLPPCHHPGGSRMPGARSPMTHRPLCIQLRAMHWAQYGLILQRVSLLCCAVPGAGRSQAMGPGSCVTLMQG